jgi:hypothetical protein
VKLLNRTIPRDRLINKKNTNMNLTIEEFCMIREAMYTCKITDLVENPSAFQVKPFFNNEENFNTVIEKLRFLLVNKPVETTNEQPKENYTNALEILNQEKQDYSRGIDGNVFVSTKNGLVTILLKRDGTYEVDTEFK